MLPEAPFAGLQVRDLVLGFAAPGHRVTRALDGVSLDVAPGEIVGVVGESGSGKTTLGKAILGLHTPADGAIRYRGQDLARLSPRARRPWRREMQMVFQDPLSSFNPRFTLRSSLALPLRLHAVVPAAEVMAEVDRLLLRVGLLPEHGARYPHELSGGQLQRVAIARAIGVRPKLIVADEAVSKLDVSVRAQVLNLLKRLNRETGVAILFITHDLGVARFLCDRIAVMFFGRVVEVGPTAPLFDAPRHPYTSALLAARHMGDQPAALDTAPLGDPAHACTYAPRCPRRQAACCEARPALRGADPAHLAACIDPLPNPALLVPASTEEFLP